MWSQIPLAALRPLLRPTPSRFPITSLRSQALSLSLAQRQLSSTPFQLLPTSGSGVKPKPEPTLFSEKSSPRDIHERPEVQRGMPHPSSGLKRTLIDASTGATGSGSKVTRNESTEEAFSGPSRPRLVYERPGDRELPKIGNKLPFVIGIGLLGLGWGLFLLHATNQERLASSVLRQVTFQLRNSKEVIAVFGEHIRLQENWWALGQPWISGTINLMQGRVDLSFRIRGDKGAGTVYFTSIRPQEKGAWRIVRYKIIGDDGEVLRLENLDAMKNKM